MRLNLLMTCIVSIPLLTCSCSLGDISISSQTSTQTVTPTSTADLSVPQNSTSTGTPTFPVASQVSLTPLPSDAAYEMLLERLKLSNPNLDFTALRISYAETSNYDPYNFDIIELKEAMYDSFSDHEYELALESADQILEKNYLIPEAHIIALRCYQELGLIQEADYHQYVINGLIKSILESGDGRNPETAYTIVIIEEEYMILDVLGITDASQGVFEEDGHAYDVFEGYEESTNDPITIYFNIDLPYQHLFDSLVP